VSEFVIRDWWLDPYDGDQAPLHVHHAGDEAFVCIDGDLQVVVGATRSSVEPGTFVFIPRGTVHTFAAPTGAHVLAVISPQVAELIDRLHDAATDADRRSLWERFDSTLV
jgi:mannose-6-phosphate isomerase-like protein (cupin superfamily)